LINMKADSKHSKVSKKKNMIITSMSVKRIKKKETHTTAISETAFTH